jgi:hypothetical protein
MVTVAAVHCPAWIVDGEMLTPDGATAAIAAWTVPAPPFKLNTRVPCTALASTGIDRAKSQSSTEWRGNDTESWFSTGIENRRRKAQRYLRLDVIQHVVEHVVVELVAEARLAGRRDTVVFVDADALRSVGVL